MKKKDKELTKYSAIYDLFLLYVSIILSSVVIAGFIWLKVTDQYHLIPGLTGKALTAHWLLLGGPYISLPWVIFFLRTRVIDQNGISAKLLGIRYKYINRADLMSYRIELYLPRHMKKKYIREALIFTSKPNDKGKSTVIIVYATKEAVALAEKYFGPPAYVQEGISFDDEKES